MKGLLPSNELRTKSSPELTEQEIARFWATVTMSDSEDDCWIWEGFTHRGYGRFPVKKRIQKGRSTHENFIATRVSFFIANNIDPKGKIIMHSCDNPSCVNPKHLSLGTSKENTEDMHRKKRANPPKGEDHWQKKIKVADVKKIRQMWATGSKQTDIAFLYGVDQALISRIVNFKQWSHV